MNLEAVSAIVEQLAELVMLADPGSGKPDGDVDALLHALAGHLESTELPADVRSAIVACVESGRTFAASVGADGQDDASGLPVALVKLPLPSYCEPSSSKPWVISWPITTPMPPKFTAGSIVK